jgi:dihydroflavonol-4-reductase
MEGPMQKNIAVTGASGHIGNTLCRLLVDKGYRVKAMYHSGSKSLEGLPLQLIRGDVLSHADLEQLIAGCETVINCAAIISIHGDPKGMVLKTNTVGPKNILEISKRLGVKKIIHISSTHAVMETPSSLSFNETRPYKTKEDYAYDYSKAVGEQIMLAGAKDGPEVVVLRPSSVIGPYDFKPSEMGKALIDFYNQEIPVLPEGGYDFTDVRDVAHSIFSSIENGRNGEVYLLSGKYYSLKELVMLVQKVTGKKVPQKVVPYWLLKSVLPIIKLYSKLSHAEPLFTIEAIDALKNGHPSMDHSKAAAQLGYHPRPLEETLRDFYEWQRSNHTIK